MHKLRPAFDSPGEWQQLMSDLAASASYASHRDVRGTVGGGLQEALAHSIEARVKARLSIVLEGIGDAFYALDENWRFTYINRAAEAFFGLPRDEMLEKVIWEVFPESAGTDLRRRYEEVFASGLASSFEGKAVSAPDRHLEFHVFPYDGGVGVSFRDWTERRLAEEQLRESEARLTSLLDNVPSCMFYQTSHSSDYQARKVLYVSKTCEKLTGVPADEVQANPALLYNLVLPEYHERMQARELEWNREIKEFEAEFEMWHAKTGEARWHRIIVTPRTLEGGDTVWDGIQIDITEHKRAEEHLRLLVNELNHRVKNTLATVQSLAVQSFQRLASHGGGDFAASYGAFEARLFALARSHDVLTRENWEGASLREVVSEAFAAYRSLHPDETDAVGIEGPDLRVAPSMALSLSMALHELCTNALKYGALGAEGGRVRVSWSTPTSSGDTRLVMRWEEQGGPPVAPPSRRGFGSRLIQHGLARQLDGTVDLAYEPTGVVCTIDVPLS